MSVLLILLSVFWGILLTITLLNVLWGPFLRRGEALCQGPLVSLLVPVRNEEGNISACLSGLRKQTFQNLQILVLNDHSVDDTWAIAAAHVSEDARINLIEGEPLPSGWTGKNWACHQLAQHAKGDILIFTDADNRYHPYAVAHTVGWMKRLQLDGFSAFPRQHTGTFFEKLVIPVVDLFVYGMLPLRLVYLTRFPSLSAANGQWIAFTRQTYRKIGGHQSVRGEIVEDVALARRLKRKGLRMATAAGTDMVWARMYHSAREVWEGLSKNMFGLVNYSLPLFFAVVLLLLMSMVLSYGLLAFPQFRLHAAGFVGANMLFRGLLAWRFRHPFLTSVLLHPFGILAALVISVNSVRIVKSGRVTWKGRQIHRKDNKRQKTGSGLNLDNHFKGSA